MGITLLSGLNEKKLYILKPAKDIIDFSFMWSKALHFKDIIKRKGVFSFASLALHRLNCS